MLRCYGICLYFFALSFSLAQAWTIQTVAFPNPQDAYIRADYLRSLGFDGYNESVLYQGQNYTRVRTACFSHQQAAERFAVQMASFVTKEAVAVELSQASMPRLCVQEDLGFRVTPAWGISYQNAEKIVFWIRLAAQQGFIGFDGTWHILQNDAEVRACTLQTSSNRPQLSALFSTSRFGTLLQAETREGKFLVSSGTILWQSGGFAVIQHGDVIAAISLTRLAL